MTWKTYTLHLLMTNLVMAVIIYLIIVFQDHLPLNPLHFAGMEPLLAFNTAISFITNTDWQAYGGDHVSDVHLRHHRLRRRHGLYPGLLAQRRGHGYRQFLPRPGSLHQPRADAGSVRAGCAADPAGRTPDTADSSRRTSDPGYTAFTTGSVNAMRDSFTPLGAVALFAGMMLQCICGGKGVGFLAVPAYDIIAVFVAGLMVGRTPEFLGKKIEKPEIVLVSLTLLIHPRLIASVSA